MDNWSELAKQGEEAVSRNDFAAAESAWRLAADCAQAEFGINDRRYALSLERVAEMCWRQNRLIQVEPICRKLLELYEVLLGPDHADVGVMCQNLAMLYHSQKRLEDAEPFYMRAFRIRAKLLGAEHEDVRNMVEAYAKLLVTLGRAAEAEDLKSAMNSVKSGKWNRSGHYRAISIEDAERLTGPDPDEMLTAPPHAVPQPQADEWQTAPSNTVSQPAPSQTPPSPAKPDASPVQANKGGGWLEWNKLMVEGDEALEQGDNLQAEEAFAEALDVLKEHDIVDERLTMTLESLSESLWKQGKFVEAQPYCEMTLSIYESLLGAGHQDVGIMCNNLAMLCHAIGNYDRAEELYRRAMNIRSPALGTNHPDVITIMTNLANALFLLNRGAEARQLKAITKSVSSGRWANAGVFKAMSAPPSPTQISATVKGDPER